MADDENAETQANLDVANENKNAVSSNLDDVIRDTVRDVPPPSAAMPEEPPVSDSVTGANPQAGGAAPPAGKRGRGRPRKNGADTPPGDQPRRPKLEGVYQAAPPIDQSTAGIEPCAEICTMLVNTSGLVLAGEEGAMTKDEQLLAKGGFVAYFKAKGVESVPAWVILAGSLSPYYLRLFTSTPAKTTAASGVRKAWFGIKEFFRKRKDARFNRRDYNERENNSGAETGETGIS